ncbi:MAG TPA: ABC transporter ATP-binding protein [Bradyrhizobium sp.]|nr:ABC transporter ATP-binding protein [Bradyrhizobium sp.]
MAAAITVEELSKCYLLGHRSKDGAAGTSFREAIEGGARTLISKTADLIRGRPIVQGDEVEQFWALRDVSFELQFGEIIGIIGRNGAGKSTLLKILSRITEPDRGRAILRGRVASLLEVGTGFHPELTGRENIYLNGAILGMTRAEIKRKFDEIVDFAEVERFLDTPVKRYSSGMYVRLAFAVAAHLEPEILIVDEVLAVGDTEFQKKCLGKMSEVAGGGRTVLFVSHNLTAVEALCPRSLYLADGKVVADAASAKVIELYLKRGRELSNEIHARSHPIDSGLHLERTKVQSQIHSGDALEFEFQFSANTSGRLRECAVLLYAERGVRVALADLREQEVVPYRFEAGRFHLRVKIASLPLVEGELMLGLHIATDERRSDLLDLAHVDILAPKLSEGFPKYAPEYRGYWVLDAAANIVEVSGENSARMHQRT